MGKGERVLVTGGCGFIGAALSSQLLKDGFEVHAASRFKRAASIPPQIDWWETDVTQEFSIGRTMTALRPDYVIHLAAEVTGDRDSKLVMPMLMTNIIGSLNVLSLGKKLNCQRVILAGSMEEPDSTSDPSPSSPYSAAKWAASGYARMFYRLYDVPVVILKLFMVYGPGQRDLRKLIPYVITSFLKEEAPTLTSGQRPVDWVYIDDVVRAFRYALRTPGIEGETIDIGSGELVTVGDIVRRLQEIMKPAVSPSLGALPDRPLEQIRRADLRCTREQLGWSPQIGLTEGLQETVQWYANEFQLNPAGSKT